MKILINYEVTVPKLFRTKIFKATEIVEGNGTEGELIEADLSKWRRIFQDKNAIIAITSTKIL